MAQIENPTENTSNKIEYITPQFSIHSFETTINEQNIIFQVLKMTDSLFIFINDKNSMQLENIYVALVSKYDNTPMGTSLCGYGLEQGLSEGFPLRLTKKLGKTVYITCNLKNNQNSEREVEARINDEIKAHPDLF